MLLGVVLVGRALEERAKLQASADMAALQVRPPRWVSGNEQTARQVAAGCRALFWALVYVVRRGQSPIRACLPGSAEAPALAGVPCNRSHALKHLHRTAPACAPQGLLPPKARMLLGDGSWREVPSESVAAGDLLTVLPGDRVPGGRYRTVL